MRTAQEISDVVKRSGIVVENIMLADTNDVNARVIPDLDVLIITKGMLELLSDEEIIAVLLHEKSHIERKDLRSSGVCHGFEPRDVAMLRERIADLDAAVDLDNMGIGREILASAIKKVATALHLDFMRTQEEHPSVRERLEAIK